jgi:hypothetical protein
VTKVWIAYTGHYDDRGIASVHFTEEEAVASYDRRYLESLVRHRGTSVPSRPLPSWLAAPEPVDIEEWETGHRGKRLRWIGPER